MDKPYEIQPGIVTDLPLSLVDFDPDQPRKDVPEDYINNELAPSIKASGVKQPITVRPNPDQPGRFYVVYGECRTRASRKARKKTIPAILDDSETDELTRLLDQVRENEHRRGLNPVELAQVLKRLQTEFGCKSHKAIEQTLEQHGLKKMSRSYVANTVRLLDLPAWAQQKIRTGELTAAHGKYLLPATASDKVTQRVHDQLQDEQHQNITTRGLQQLVYSGFQMFHRDLTGYGVEFDPADACNGCQKRRKVSGPYNDATFCMDGDCFDQKNETAQAERKAAQQKAREQLGKDPEGPTEIEPDENGRVDVSGLSMSEFDFIDMAPFDTTECTVCEHCHPVEVMSGDRDAGFNVPCYRAKHRAHWEHYHAEREREGLIVASLRGRLIQDELPDDEHLQTALAAWSALRQPARKDEDGDIEFDVDGFIIQDEHDAATEACNNAGITGLTDCLTDLDDKLYHIARYVVTVMEPEHLFRLAQRQGITADSFTLGAAWCQSQTNDQLIDALIGASQADEDDRARLSAMSKDELTARIVDASLPWPDDLRETWERMVSRETEQGAA